MRIALLILAALTFGLSGCAGTADDTGGNDEWPCVGGDREWSRHSQLDQIDRDNVRNLEVAWTYHTDELKNGRGRTIECTPLMVDGVLYITTGNRRVVALDAATGAEIWQYDPGRNQAPLASGGVNRGVAYWSDGVEGGAVRILHGVSDGRLISLDARTGKPDPAFGRDGVRDLREDLEPYVKKLAYGPTSAPGICGDVVVLGVSCGEGPGISAPGDVRGFDVRTGKQVWRFHTVPRPGEVGHDTWEGDSWKRRGAANAWGGVSVDSKRGWVFVGLGSAAFDFYGGDRKGKNLFANCVVALDGETGRRIWHFQTLHHDLWDHDLPVCPNLITLRHGGRSRDVVAQVTKTGYVYVLDRETGEPLFPVVERPVPASDVPGEQAWPTQPIPVKPPPFVRTAFNENDISDLSPETRAAVKKEFDTLRSGTGFNPPSLKGTITVPGFHGGATWSGASFDPATGLLYVNGNEIPNLITLVPAKKGRGFPYRIKGYLKFRGPDGYPAIKPPWGTVSAIDLQEGTIRWQVPLGEHPELTRKGIPRTGTENFGGTIVTAGGLVFIGGSKDERFHAFDKTTGELLWEHPLPAGGYATPMTYAVDGRQYVVIAAGGAGKPGTKAGDAFVAFALPRAKPDGTLALHTRSRVRSPRRADAPETWSTKQETLRWDPAKTALIICDMWDAHWCQGATRRVAELAPHLNRVVKKARDLGIHVIHAPSSCVDFYAGTPQRERAKDAPFTASPVPLATAERWGTKWCWPQSDREPDMPIDDSDMGCDCERKCKLWSPWKRQIASIDIADEDTITHDGQETYNLLAQHGIDNVILTGVHLNMCVLGRPFAIRQMVNVGKNVVLMRDMTDTMYNSKKAPFVSHFRGTDLVVEHVERHWCPSITSVDLVGGTAFRFHEDPLASK